jgi:catechol 2,3-dioxygenase-like lactoylglutathione lyase family enzyme
LYKVTQPALADRRTRAGMNHLALRLASPEEVDRAAEILARAGIKVLKGPATHKEDNDRYLYFEDPDGNMIELVASTLAGWPAHYLRA